MNQKTFNPTEMDFVLGIHFLLSKFHLCFFVVNVSSLPILMRYYRYSRMMTITATDIRTIIACYYLSRRLHASFPEDSHMKLSGSTLSNWESHFGEIKYRDRITTYIQFVLIIKYRKQNSLQTGKENYEERLTMARRDAYAEHLLMMVPSTATTYTCVFYSFQ